ncbi:MAG: hypothetical protein IT440_13000 [Phycisphaeraceae bacterium]|nr:hypothetical protein [Phycisphaeraceae bacterium]
MHHSRYVWTSLAVSLANLFWQGWFDGVVFNIYKQHRVGTLASVLALMLAIAAYQQPNRRRSLALVALMIAILEVLAHVMLVPL